MLMYNIIKIVDIEDEYMNKYIYIIGTVCVLFVIGLLFIKLLPFLIIAGIVVYVVAMLKGKIENYKRKEEIKNRQESYNNADNIVQDMYNSPEDYTNGEIIDVEDYEDVDKK